MFGVGLFLTIVFLHGGECFLFVCRDAFLWLGFFGLWVFSLSEASKINFGKPVSTDHSRKKNENTQLSLY